jgi:hypothetical protein
MIIVCLLLEVSSFLEATCVKWTKHVEKLKYLVLVRLSLSHLRLHECPRFCSLSVDYCNIETLTSDAVIVTISIYVKWH